MSARPMASKLYFVLMLILWRGGECVCGCMYTCVHKRYMVDSFSDLEWVVLGC